MQQLYRFAELGQLSTALLHDLANHLTVLTLDIEDLDKKRHSQAIARAKQSIFYLDKMVDQVRAQLQDGGPTKNFKVMTVVEETIGQLQDKARNLQISLEARTSAKVRDVHCQGDPTRLRQVITILTSNAIDAYDTLSPTRKPRRVVLELSQKQRCIQISIQDWGAGISKTDRAKLFKPFYSTKEDGMGIGLFIAKQLLTTHFKGRVELGASTTPTEFIISLPLKKM